MMKKNSIDNSLFQEKHFYSWYLDFFFKGSRNPLTINDNMIRFVFQGKVGVAALWKVKPRRRGGWKSREEALGDPVKGK